MSRGWTPLLGLLGTLAVLVSGCGSSEGGATPEPKAASTMDVLPGERVGELAEKQLEAEHQEMAPGTVDCPDLKFELAAEVRCMKTATLSEGRRVKVAGTVTVTSTEGYGKLHVLLDDEVAEYGVDADHLAGQVEQWLRAQGKEPAEVRCPYLVGEPDAVVTCTADVAGRRAKVAVAVTEVDDEEFRTRYHLSWKKSRQR